MTNAAARFAEMSRARYLAGVREYRGGDEDAPFEGDPIQEAIEECIDLEIYAREAWKQRRITRSDWQWLQRVAFEAFVILDGAQVEIGPRRAVGEGEK